MNAASAPVLPSASRAARALAALLGVLVATASSAGVIGPAHPPQAPGAHAPAEVATPRSSATPALRQAVSAIEDEDVGAAAAIIDPLLAAHPGDRAIATVAGMVRFDQQRYAEAVELLERGGYPTGAVDYLALARNARDLTRSYTRAESAHFVVSYPKGKDEVLVPYVLETLEKQRAALEEDLGWAAPGKVTIEFLDDTHALARMSPLTDEEIRTSGTIALCKFNKLMVVSPKALLHGYDWLDTAAHEYTHYVVTARTRNNTPVWLHEGLAKYSETRWRGPGGELSAWSAELLRKALAANDLVTFAQMHPSMAKLPSQERAALAFAEVTVAVEYLEKQGGRALMNRILDGIASGATAEAAIAKATGQPFEAFVAAWKRYMAARPVPGEGTAVAEVLHFKDPKHPVGDHPEWAELPDERARGYARLGEIFRARGRFGAARLEYAKAITRVGQGFPVLSSRFALAAVEVGRDGEAKAALAEALKRNPHHASLQLQMGRIHARAKAWPEARSALLRANAVDPFDPEIHALLAQAEDALANPAAAERERAFARRLADEGAPR